MKTQTQFKNSSLISVVNGSIVVKDSTGGEHTFVNASVVSVNNGTIIIESEWKPKNGELIKYTWGGTRYCIFREIIADQLWSYGCSVEKLSEFPYDCDVPKFRPYSKNLKISPVTPEEQKEFDDFCKSQGKVWNKETLQWEKYKWVPKDGERYYIIYGNGEIDHLHYQKSEFQDKYIDLGNCFQTKEQAQEAAKKLKELFKSL